MSTAIAWAKTNRYPFAVVVLAFGIMLADGISHYSIAVMYPFIQSKLGLTRTQVGLITTAYASGGTVAVVLAGGLLDRLGVKRMTVFSVIGITACMVVFPFAFTLPVIMAIMVFLGITACPEYLSTTMAIMHWFPARIRASAMSIKQVGVSTGGTLAAAVVPTVALLMGWRLTAAAIGLLVLAIGLVFQFTYHDAPHASAATHKTDLSVLRTIGRDRSLITIMAWGGIFCGLQYVVVSYFIIFLVEELKFSPVAAGGLFAAAQVSSGIMRILWGAASDFLFRGRRIVVLALTGFLTVLWMLGSSVTGAGVPGVVVLLIAVAIGISTLSFHGVVTTVIGEVAQPERVGITVGVASMAMRASMMIMPPLFGYLVDISNSYRLGWQASAAVAMISTVALLVFAREKRPKR